MNVEEIASQPAINVTPCLWPLPVDADMPKSGEPSEVWNPHAGVHGAYRADMAEGFPGPLICFVRL
jgi:hypothetical protein